MLGRYLGRFFVRYRGLFLVSVSGSMIGFIVFFSLEVGLVFSV